MTTYSFYDPSTTSVLLKISQIGLHNTFLMKTQQKVTFSHNSPTGCVEF